MIANGIDPACKNLFEKRRSGVRRSLRPTLRGMKSEDIDKYWIRRFRIYLERKQNELFLDQDSTFWKQFISRESEPGKNSTYKSYNKSYRRYLTRKDTFVEVFKRFFDDEGESGVYEKHSDDKVLAGALCDYARKEIMGIFDSPSTSDTETTKNKRSSASEEFERFLNEVLDFTN
jgi:hypothetical protein